MIKHFKLRYINIQFKKGSLVVVEAGTCPRNSIKKKNQ